MPVEKIIMDSQLADEMFDKMPEVGDTINWNETECLITRINVVNQRKLCLKVEPKREVKRFQDFADSSFDRWEKLPERFLEDSDNGNQFTRERSLNKVHD